MKTYVFIHLSDDNMVKEQVGPTAPHENQATDLPTGTGHHWYF